MITTLVSHESSKMVTVGLFDKTVFLSLFYLFKTNILTSFSFNIRTLKTIFTFISYYNTFLNKNKKYPLKNIKKRINVSLSCHILSNSHKCKKILTIDLCLPLTPSQTHDLTSGCAILFK
jgi:hypothetical protein